MGLVYYNGRFIPEEHIQKAVESDQVLRLLRSFLDANEPGLVRFLVNTWRSQGNAITYKELREAIENGDIDPELLAEWMQDYSRFVAKCLHPAWLEAMAVAAADLERRYPVWFFDPMADGVRAWTKARAAEFIAGVTSAQAEGIRALIMRAAVLEDLTVDELARAIRPMIGLTKPQSTKAMNYYETLLANGVKPKNARDKTAKYAAKLHRERAYTIARTELATAYNAGAHECTKQAQEAGFLGECVKVWCTADDERVCPTCDAMDGKEIAMDDEFTGASASWSTKLHPPMHPRCRCGVKYVEIAPPKY